jgi:nicotinamidase-related amidase
MLTTDNAALVLIDVQTNLFAAMHDRQALLANLERLVQGMQLLKVPVLWIEQTPGKIGKTIPEIRRLLGSQEPVVKTCFSCCDSPGFMEKLRESKRRQIVLAGIETHVCVYQTAMDLLRAGYRVEVVADAVSSRTLQNRQLALERIRQHAGGITTVEMVLFELLRTSEHASFRDILRLVK